MSPDTAAAQERGRARDLKATSAELLAEFESETGTPMSQETSSLANLDQNLGSAQGVRSGMHHDLSGAGGNLYVSRFFPTVSLGIRSHVGELAPHCKWEASMPLRSTAARSEQRAGEVMISIVHLPVSVDIHPPATADMALIARTELGLQSCGSDL